MVLIELVEQGDGERATGTGEEGGRRRRFGRRRARAEAAPEGANRAERRAALRRRGPAPVEPEAALAGEDVDEDLTDELDEEERPAVPTDAEIEAGATAAGAEADELERRPTRPRPPPEDEPGVTEAGVDEDEDPAAQADDEAAETAEDEDQDRKQPDVTVRRMRLVVAYDGAPFSGFARQRDRRTVQGELEAAWRGWPSSPWRPSGPGGPTPGCMPGGRSSMPTCRRGWTPSGCGGPSTAGWARPSSCARPAGRPPGSTPGCRPGAGPTCTASTTPGPPTRCCAASCSPGPGRSTCRACARRPGPAGRARLRRLLPQPVGGHHHPAAPVPRDPAPPPAGRGPAGRRRLLLADGPRDRRPPPAGRRRPPRPGQHGHGSWRAATAPAPATSPPPHGLVLEVVRYRPQVGGAVDVDHGAGQGLGPRGGQEDHHPGDLLGGRHPVEGALGADGVAAGPVQERGGHVGGHVPGRDRGHVDPVRAEGPRHGLPEAVQARLAGPVGGVVGLAPERPPRGDVHDPAPAGGHHVRGHGVDEVGRAEQVGVDRPPPDPLPLLVAGLQDRLGLVDPGVVDQHVDPAQLVHDPRDQRPRLLGVGQVGLGQPVPAGAEPGQGVVGRPPVGAELDDHRGPAGGELLGHGAADPARAARDQRHHAPVDAGPVLGHLGARRQWQRRLRTS